MTTIRLLIEYDGTAFSGWQLQAGDRTVQETLEQAAEKAAGEHQRVHGSGRTDAGVHALGQVAHLDTPSPIPPDRLAFALNTHLPEDVAVLRSEAVAPDFHARFSARGKTYVYRIFQGPVRPVLLRHRACHVPHPLDLEAMEKGGKRLLGRHDFQGFACAGSSVKTTVRTLTRFEMARQGDGLFLLFSADGFLYKMVRTMVGTLIEVGRGRRKPKEVEEILLAGDRGGAGPSAPGGGLSLVGVLYDDWKTPLEGLPLSELLSLSL